VPSLQYYSTISGGMSQTCCVIVMTPEGHKYIDEQVPRKRGRKLQ